MIKVILIKIGQFQSISIHLRTYLHQSLIKVNNEVNF